MPQNLFDQLAVVELSLLSRICNTETTNPGFRIALREIPAFAGEFTIGDAAGAYFRHMLDSIDRAAMDRREIGA